MTHERDAWDEFGDSGNGIEGQWLKCANGHWTLDDDPIEIGDDGLKMCVVMDTAVVGEVIWEDKKITAKNVGRLSAGFVAPDKITTGWNPYTAFQAVRADDGHLGDLLTFTSSSWGGRNAFQRLVNPYRTKLRLQFPIVTLATRERGDTNGISTRPLRSSAGVAGRTFRNSRLRPRRRLLRSHSSRGRA